MLRIFLAEPHWWVTFLSSCICVNEPVLSRTPLLHSNIQCIMSQHITAANGFFECVQTLLLYGADPNIQGLQPNPCPSAYIQRKSVCVLTHVCQRCVNADAVLALSVCQCICVLMYMVINLEGLSVEICMCKHLYISALCQCLRMYLGRCINVLRMLACICMCLCIHVLMRMVTNFERLSVYAFTLANACVGMIAHVGCLLQVHRPFLAQRGPLARLI